MAKEYRAICGSTSHLSRGGFLTEEKAEQYVVSNFCDSCRLNAENYKNAPCWAEWLVKKYDEDVFRELSAHTGR